MLDILYQDNAIVVVNKPSGWLVHRSWLDKNEKIVVMQTLRDQIGQHVYPVHRLDRPTSGVLLFALSRTAATYLCKQFENNTPCKIYHAVVRGHVQEKGEIDYALSIIRDKIADKYASPDKLPQQAITEYYPVATTEVPLAIGRYPTSRYSLLTLIPKTGRKHQLRRHMSHIAHPIVGDTTHGDLRQNRGIAEHFSCTRLMLHASSLTLTHPTSKELMTITAPWDEQWQSLLASFRWPVTLANFELFKP